MNGIFSSAKISDFDEKEADEEEEKSENSEEESDGEDDVEDKPLNESEAQTIVEMLNPEIGKSIDHPLIKRAYRIINEKHMQSIKLEENMSKLRRFCFKTSMDKRFSNFILLIIAFNVVLLFLQSNTNLFKDSKIIVANIDKICVAIYISEIIIKIYALQKDYFKYIWNYIDLLIIFVSCIDYVASFYPNSFNSASLKAFRVLRTLRALRLFKLMRNFRLFKSLIILIESIIASFENCIIAIFLLLFIMYFYAVIGFTIYKEVSPNYFGTFDRAFFSMFQLCTLDDWFDIYDSVKILGSVNILFFITFIVICSFIIMNYITAVLTDNACQAAVDMSSTNKWIQRLMDDQQKIKEKEEDLKAKKKMRKKEAKHALKKLMSKNNHFDNITEILALLGEIERNQHESDGHQAVFGHLIDEALKYETG